MGNAEVRTQAELDAAIAANKRAICLSGSFSLVVQTGQPHIVLTTGATLNIEACGSSQPRVEAVGSSQPRVVARDSSQPYVVARQLSQPRVEALQSSRPRVVAWGSSRPCVVAGESSQPHVVARDSSQLHVVAWGSSRPHVEARGSSQLRVVAEGSSQPRVEARGYAQVSASGKVIVRATARVAVLVRGSLPKVRGGKQTCIRIRNAKEWCNYYGIPIKSGVVVLYKSVNGDYSSGHDGAVFYKPGTKPKAPDWDGGDAECGGGLHFSPTPMLALDFYSPNDGRLVGCPVRVSEIVVHGDAECLQKVKAPRCCGKVFECDRNGRRVEAKP